MASYIVNLDIYKDKAHKKLVRHEETPYEEETTAALAACDFIFNYIPDKYLDYVHVYITTKDLEEVQDS